MYWFMKMVYKYNYHNPGYYPSSWLLFKTHCFEDWIQSQSSGGTCSVEPMDRARLFLSLGQETDTSSIYWTQLNRFYLKTETEFSLRNIMF
jgi:hypothetical protein